MLTLTSCFSAYNFSLSYRRGKDNANADFLFRLPLSPTDEDISGSCALTNPDDLGVYLIRACGLVPGIGLGGLTPLSQITPSYALGGLILQPDPPISSGLPLSHADFRTHRAPLAPPHMVGSIDRPHMVSAERSLILGPSLQDALEANLRFW